MQHNEACIDPWTLVAIHGCLVLMPAADDFLFSGLAAKLPLAHTSQIT